jgi:hypothetical protein
VSEYSFNQCSPLSNVVTDELECDWVTKLVLSGNKLDDDAAAVLSLGLRELRHISHLDLSDNPMTWRAAGALSELLSPPLKVTVSICCVAGASSIRGFGFRCSIISQMRLPFVSRDRCLGWIIAV